MEKTRILIVEDEIITAKELELRLKNLGYGVISIVDTGIDAVRKAEEEKPDLVMMDIRINGDMDGIETAEIIHKRFGIPVVFATANMDEERMERAKAIKPFGYVKKPIQEKDLASSLKSALHV